MSQAFAQFPEGSRVRIEAVDSLAQAHPDASVASHAKGLVGQERIVIEADRYGYSWLSWDADGTSADFCLRPGDLSLVAPAPEPVQEQAAAPGGLPSWRELREQRGEFAASTVGVLAAFAVYVLAGLSHRLLFGTAAPDIDSLWFLVPAGVVFAATLVAAIYALRRRRLQYILELAACAGLWIVLMRAV